MFQLKLSYKRLLSHKRITLFSIISFSLSFLLILIIAQYAISELQTDDYHKNKEDIFLMKSDGNINVPAVLIDQLYDESLIKNVIPFAESWDGTFVQLDGNLPLGVNSLFVDSSFFNVFSFEFVKGNSETCLNAPFTAVITESESVRIFGDVNPIGKILKMDNEFDLTITGVIKDYPRNSIFSSSFFISFTSYRVLEPFTFTCGWGCHNIHSFLQLHSPESKAQVVERIIELTKQEKGSDGWKELYLIPLKEAYFLSNDEVYNIINIGDRSRLGLFIFLGILIFAISIVNYINFILSLTIQRQQISATLKVFGNRFSHFFISYFIDSLIIAILSILLVFLLYDAFLFDLLLRNFSLFSQVENSNHVLAVLAFILLVIAVVSALFGAIWSNKYEITKKQLIHQSRNRANSIMLALQFGIVIFLIVCGIMVNKQLHFIHEADHGFDKENIIYIRGGEIKSEMLRNELSKISGVMDISFSDAIPGKETQNWTWGINTLDGKKYYSTSMIPVDKYFLELYGFQLVEGRLFDPTRSNEEANIVINEAAVKYLKQHKGWENPMGKVLLKKWWKNKKEGRIIGIVKDNFFFSMHHEVPVMTFICSESDPSYLSIKMIAGFDHQTRIINEVEKVWKSVNSEIPFSFMFFEDHLNTQYQKEREFMQLTIWLSLFGLIITLLGLIGMVTFISSQKTKEIGIRKVNGARARDIVLLLNLKFFKIILFAFIIASPLAYWMMDHWLAKFAYRTGLSWWVFILAAMVVVITSFVTVSLQSLKSAKRNPVEALRYE